MIFEPGDILFFKNWEPRFSRHPFSWLVIRRCAGKEFVRARNTQTMDNCDNASEAYTISCSSFRKRP